MNYSETLEYLFNSLPMYSRIGAPAYKEGLENTLALDKYFGHPHRKFKTIHVGGTNGKGSVSHLLAATLQQAGYKTGLYTSPHVKDFRERIRINGEMISKDFVLDFVAKNRSFFDELLPSFFEMSVLMAFDYFAKNEVEIAVIEVGLGGRLDSTNIITPELSVITNISLDHMDLLGNTVKKIAGEKAGIIKSDVPVVIGEAKDKVRQVFEQKAEKEGAPIYFAEECVVVTKSDNNENYHTKAYSYTFSGKSNREIINVGLLGSYQQKNITTALTAIKILNEIGFEISPEAFHSGFEEVITLTGLLGRWQVVQEKPLVIMDIAHNEAGVTYVVEQLSDIRYNKLRVVLGMVSDKDVEKILSLLPKNATYYFAKADIPRALNREELKEKALQNNLHGNSYLSVKEAFNAALADSSADDVVFVGGSNFVVAEALTCRNS